MKCRLSPLMSVGFALIWATLNPDPEEKLVWHTLPKNCDWPDWLKGSE